MIQKQYKSTRREAFRWLLWVGLVCACADVLAAPANDLNPPKTDVLSWTQAQRDTYFLQMERVSAGHIVAHGAQVHQFDAGKPLDLALTQSLIQYMQDQHTAGLIVIQDNAIRYERYAQGDDERGRYTSFSVAKSLTSTLVGAAIQDGYIKSLNEDVTTYLPDLKGSAYEGVSIRQLLTMTSGVRWNEDYSDPHSDVARFLYAPADPGVDPTVSYMRKLPRESAPGTKWVYKTGETSLVGVLVTAATHRTLAQYLAEKIWLPYGMQEDGFWMVSPGTEEDIGGCCLSAALRDFSRFGQFILDGGVINGTQVLPPDWLHQATRTQVAIGADAGYGFQWWTNGDGTFDARGIFGQMIHIDPKRHLVIAMSSSWSSPVGADHLKARLAMIQSVNAGLDAETGR